MVCGTSFSDVQVVQTRVRKMDESREDPADSFYDMVQDSIVKISYYMALFVTMLFVVALPIFAAITPFLSIAPSD